MNDVLTPRLGEVIAANTTGFTAQSYELYELPPLGELVKTKDGEVEIYAIVAQATTQGLDEGRKAVARGKAEASEEAIYQASPQLAHLLRSEFTALAVGFKEGGSLRQYLPPRPARLHSFVHPCTQEEAQAFGTRLEFLSLLVQAETDTPGPELVAATLRQMSKAQADPASFLTAAGKELAGLLGRDYQQLRSVLERIKP